MSNDEEQRLQRVRLAASEIGDRIGDAMEASVRDCLDRLPLAAEYWPRVQPMLEKVFMDGVIAGAGMAKDVVGVLAAARQKRRPEE